MSHNPNEPKDPAKAIHMDIYGHMGLFDAVLLAHGNIATESGDQRILDVIALLESAITSLKAGMAEYNGVMRCLKTPLGDLYFEISTNKFMAADSREQAEELAKTEDPMTMSYDQLRRLYPKIEVVAES